MIVIADSQLRQDRHTSIMVIDADEYEEALRDPKLHAQLAEADAFLARLEREGRFF
ncbi:MAG TPA: hypothetical protein VN238_22745 [Solirubrobacteraceae bacterium]|nr:hypothetical protein [Solirubrobacteraceae bacterium]